jgi:hypothetical protein
MSEAESSMRLSYSAKPKGSKAGNGRVPDMVCALHIV